eukprot:COSAG01_NODE_2374_length_7803_cov_5.861241_3_plen_141_part_00
MSRSRYLYAEEMSSDRVEVCEPLELDTHGAGAREAAVVVERGVFRWAAEREPVDDDGDGDGDGDRPADGGDSAEAAEGVTQVTPTAPADPDPDNARADQAWSADSTHSAGPFKLTINELALVPGTLTVVRRPLRPFWRPF